MWTRETKLIVDATHVAPRGHPRVLLVGSDRRFRSLASTLLAQRGCQVLLREGREDITEFTTRRRPDVVVIDASRSLAEAQREAGKLQALCPGVGVVIVTDDLRGVRGFEPVLLKWSAFGALFGAIEQARDRAHRETANGAA